MEIWRLTLPRVAQSQISAQFTTHGAVETASQQKKSLVVKR
jgi:hypothetical protein